MKGKYQVEILIMIKRDFENNKRLFIKNYVEYYFATDVGIRVTTISKPKYMTYYRVI